MRLFISWSGDLSHKLAERLYEWLPKVVQKVDPYMSSASIEKGARWATDLGQELESAQFGIVVLTSDNRESPWINFEAGALAKKLDEKLAPVLFGIRASDVAPPLSQFQLTELTQTDFGKLLKSINASAGELLMPEARLADVYDHWWPDLEKAVNQILKSHKPQHSVHRNPADILEEVLATVREQSILLANPEQFMKRSVESIVAQAVAAYFGSETSLAESERAQVLALFGRWSHLYPRLSAHFDGQDTMQTTALKGDLHRFKQYVDEVRETMGKKPGRRTH